FGQGRAGSKSRPAAEHGRDRGATRSRWPASPLRAPRGLIMTKVPHVDIDGHPFARTTNPRLLRPRSRARRWACERASVRARSWPSRSTQDPHPVGAQMSGWRRTVGIASQSDHRLGNTPPPSVNLALDQNVGKLVFPATPATPPAAAK